MTVAVCAATLLAAALGCQQTRRTGAYYRPIPPKPRPLMPAPADARANALVLNVSAAPLDTNGNGYPDLIYATAHLFDTRYPPAIHEDGRFVFAMYAPGDAGRPESPPIREWRLDGESSALARSRSAFGDCYRFRLSLLENGTDTIDVRMADIVARFEPADGRAPMYSGEVASIQIGQRVRVPRFQWSDPGRPTTDVRAWP